VYGGSLAVNLVLICSDPLITLGDIGEVLFQGIKFQNVDSNIESLSENIPHPGAVISGLVPSVVALQDISVMVSEIQVLSI